MSGNGTLTPRAVRYCGPDRRSRTVGVAPLPVARAVSTALLVAVAAGGPACFLVLERPSSSTVASYLLAAGGLASVVAGGVRLVAWRMIGHAFHGWLGGGFVVFGVGELISTGLSGSSLSSAPSIAAGGAFAGAVVAGVLVWKALTCTEVEAGFSPAAVLAGGVGAVASLVALWAVVQVNGIVPPWAAGQVARSLLCSLAGVVWVALAVMAGRSSVLGRRTASAVGLIGAGLVIGSAGSSGWGPTLAFSVPVFVGTSLVLGEALTRLDVVLSSDDRRHRRLQGELDASRRAVERDRTAVESWLHDLRNAVAALQAADAVLRAAPDRWPEARAEMADSVTAELAWLHALVESVRQLSPVALDLEQALSPVVAAERLLGAQVGLDVAGVTVFADRVALNRVVQNVLVNARRYAPNSPVEIVATAHGPRVRITIRDHGAGVHEAERSAIFERGGRGATSAGTPGSGLGLFVARSLVESMGGAITVRDAAPGACFVIEVPRSDDDVGAADGGARSAGEPRRVAPVV